MIKIGNMFIKVSDKGYNLIDIYYLFVSFNCLNIKLLIVISETPLVWTHLIIR